MLRLQLQWLLKVKFLISYSCFFSGSLVFVFHDAKLVRLNTRVNPKKWVKSCGEGWRGIIICWEIGAERGL